MPAATWPDCAGASARTRGLIGPSQPTGNAAMPRTESAERDPNAELHDFEPLRVALALGALLLALLLSL